MELQKRDNLYSGLGLLFAICVLVFIGVWSVREITERNSNERVVMAQMIACSVDQALPIANNEIEQAAQMISLEDKNTLPALRVLDNLYTFSRIICYVPWVNSSPIILHSQPLSVSGRVQNLVAIDSGDFQWI